MPAGQDKNLHKRFLKTLCKIKNWNYHDKLEAERKQQIKHFVEVYIFKQLLTEAQFQLVSYRRLQSVVNHPAYTPIVKAIINLLEYSTSEEDFINRYEKLIKQTSPISAKIVAENIYA